jgi:hypothetical protein
MQDCLGDTARPRLAPVHVLGILLVAADGFEPGPDARQRGHLREQLSELGEDPEAGLTKLTDGSIPVLQSA